MRQRDPNKLPEPELIGGAEWLDAPPALPGGRRLGVRDEGDGLAWSIQPGTLTRQDCLVADLLLSADRLAVFELSLGQTDPAGRFRASFGLLCHCQARLALPLGLTDQNVWMFGRQGAWLKVLCGGDVVDPAAVDRVELRVIRPQTDKVELTVCSLTVWPRPPAPLDDPALPSGPLLDELGQARLRNWPGKTRSTDELVQRLKAQVEQLDELPDRPDRSAWGGWRERRFEATGFFRTHHDGRRWWLVDPDGWAFFSAGCNCVRLGVQGRIDGLASALSWLPDEDDPEWPGVNRVVPGKGRMVDYLRANLVRAFGPARCKAQWDRLAPAMLRRMGFNTVANWSDTEMASAARVAYVLPMKGTFDRVAAIFRDFPDVYDPAFQQDLADYAAQLRPTRDDAALIGYFLMNEPKWGFAEQPPAAGMLYTTQACQSRNALAAWLDEQYADEAALAAAWQMPVTLARIRRGVWSGPLTAAARRDLESFSTIMVRRLFEGLSDTCRQVDPHHLNLGARYYTIPPDWALEPMRAFDVFSMNCYDRRPPSGQLGPLCRRLQLPAILGEWHFGSLDAGLPASGIGHVPTQADRGRAYRAYLESAAAADWCVGAHWFTLYDQSAIGRFDGENYNIGLLDVCHRPYEPLVEAARASHARMYDVAVGRAEPFGDAPDYLERLFM